MQEVTQCSFCGQAIDYTPKRIRIRGAMPPACVDCYIEAENSLIDNEQLSDIDKHIRDKYKEVRQLEREQEALLRSLEDQFRDAMKARRDNGIQESRTPESKA